MGIDKDYCVYIWDLKNGASQFHLGRVKLLVKEELMGRYDDEFHTVLQLKGDGRMVAASNNGMTFWEFAPEEWPAEGKSLKKEPIATIPVRTGISSMIQLS